VHACGERRLATIVQVRPDPSVVREAPGLWAMETRGREYLDGSMFRVGFGFMTANVFPRLNNYRSKRDHILSTASQ